MTKNKKILLIAGIILVVLLALVLTALLLFGGRQEQKAPLAGDMTYTVLVKNSSDQPLEGVGIYIYEDESQAELVWFDKTNAEGKMSFTAPASDKYVAVLGNVPTGYAVEDQYLITGELTEIILGAGTMSEEDMQNLTYKLGDLMMDFTITDTEGVEYTLSELLKTKKAVVLNFWYIECAPCKMEFPFMQEAYEKYKDDIEILAMNPVNPSEEDIAAFKKELGLTFPMAKVDALWEQMMKLTAYPTTVVIDRFGSIVLLHKGSIDSADTFEQLFAYFTAEDYEAKAIESIDEIVTKVEGSEENPSTPSDTDFEITLEPGETYYFNIYKVTDNRYLTVKGEDFILTYKGKEYKPSNGSLTITISSEGPSTPVELQIKNTGEEKQTYYVSMYLPKGTMGNPYSLSLGEFDVSTGAGNEKGAFGRYTAEKSGTLTVRCLRSSVSKYGFHLYNLRSGAMRNADEDGKSDEDGYKTVSVQVKKGDTVEFSVAVTRDENNYIPAGSFRFELMLTEGDGEDEKKEELPTQPYTITITDEAGNPVSGVAVNVKGEFTYVPPRDETQTDATEPVDETEPDTSNEVKVDKNIATNEKGVATLELVPGPYMVTVSAPNGYKLAQSQYTLTEKITSLSVKLEKIKYLDYKVTVLDPNGAPVPDVVVLMSSASTSVYGNTNAKGVYAINQQEDSYTVSLYGGIPDGYASPADSFTFAANSSSLTVKLIYKPGSQRNPIAVNGDFPIRTSILTAGQKVYYTVSGAGGMTVRILDENATVEFDGKTYTAVDGMVTVQIPEGSDPVSLVIGNGGTTPENYRVNIGYPWGTEQNPVVLDEVYTYITTRALGNGEKVYYSLAAVGGEALIIEDPDAFIAYNGQIYTAVDGVVTVELAADADPALVAFGSNGTDMVKQRIRVGYPWGTENNPVTLDQTYGTITTRELGAEEMVYYSMSGVGGLEMTIADPDAQVLYNGTTYTAEDGVVTVRFNAGEEAAQVAFVNKGTEAEQYTATITPPLGSEQNPIEIKGVFSTLTTPEVTANGVVYYKVSDVGGFQISIADADYVVWGGVTYPAENGVVSFTIPSVDGEISSGLLAIGNSSTEAKKYTVNVTSSAAAGTRQNPDPITLNVGSSVSKNRVVRVNTDYYYGCVVNAAGTLTVELRNNQLHGAAGTDYEITLSRNGVNDEMISAGNVTEDGYPVVSIQVAEGDLVRVHIENLAETAVRPFGLMFSLSAENPPAEEGGVVLEGKYVESEDPNATEEVTEYVEPPEVIEEEEEGGTAFQTYSVTVKNYSNKPMANVIVQLMSGGRVIDGGMTDANGLFYTLLAPGDYAVKLSFSSSGCYYEDSTALLSPGQTSLTVPVTTTLPAEGGRHWDTFNYETVELGGTYISLQSDVVSYYGFYPEEQGTYRFQASDPNAKISYWGTAAPNNLTESTLDYTGNAFTLSVGESMVGGTHYIGITGVEDSILVITRLGDAQFDVTELPWEIYVPEVAPAEVKGLPASGTLTYIDVTADTDDYKLVYNDSDKCYHLGSLNGPVVYVQLAANVNGEVPPYVHLDAMVGGVDASMGTALRWADYDDTGNYVKEDYTQAMLDHCDYAALNDYGVYPLTKDLMYMIQKGGEYTGWWDTENENHKLVFGSQEGINLDILWMFACCYFK